MKKIQTILKFHKKVEKYLYIKKINLKILKYQKLLCKNTYILKIGKKIKNTYLSKVTRY